MNKLQGTMAENNILKNLNIDTSQTSEKFQPMAEEILELLISNLQKINELESEIFKRDEDLKNPKEPNQLQPGQLELWKEYEARRDAITDAICMKSQKGGADSFGKPTKYEYITYPDTQFFFIMKSANRAVVEVLYEKGIKQKDQFVFKKDGTTWKIDTKKYGFTRETTWYKSVL